MNNEEIRKNYKCLHLADYSPKEKMCKAIEKIIEQRGEIEQLKYENSILKQDISNMYDEEVIISILEDEFNLTREEAWDILNK